MAREGLCVFVLGLRIPYLDEEVGGACDWWGGEVVQ